MCACACACLRVRSLFVFSCINPSGRGFSSVFRIDAGFLTGLILCGFQTGWDHCTCVLTGTSLFLLKHPSSPPGCLRGLLCSPNPRNTAPKLWMWTSNPTHSSATQESLKAEQFRQNGNTVFRKPRPQEMGRRPEERGNHGICPADCEE